MSEIKHVWLLWGEFDPGEWTVLGVYATHELALAARDKAISGEDPDEDTFTEPGTRVEGFRLHGEMVERGEG